MITSNELEVLRGWLAHDVPGANELRAQLSEAVEVFSSCGCGCASIGIRTDAQHEETSGVSIFGVDAEILDDDGKSVGGMMLTTRDGRLHDVDVHSWSESHVAFPLLTSVRWHLRDDL